MEIVYFLVSSWFWKELHLYSAHVFSAESPAQAPLDFQITMFCTACLGGVFNRYVSLDTSPLGISMSTKCSLYHMTILLLDETAQCNNFHDIATILLVPVNWEAWHLFSHFIPINLLRSVKCYPNFVARNERLLNIYISGTVLSTLHTLTYLILTPSQNVSTIISPIIRMNKLCLRQVKVPCLRSHW